MRSHLRPFACVPRTAAARLPPPPPHGQVAVVFGLLGATISTAQIYVFPALMLLVRAAQVAGAREGEEADSRGLLATDIHDASLSDAAVSDLQQLPYVPRSALWLRVHAAGLLCIAAFICALGTGANIFSTWLQ